MSLTKEEVRLGYLVAQKRKWPVVRRTIEGTTDEICLSCTQLGVSSYAQRKIVDEWCNYLRLETKRFRKIESVSRMNRAMLNAICHQEDLKYLFIKWLVAESIESIKQLSNLSFLYLAISPRIVEINALASLKKLKVLYLIDSASINDLFFLNSLTDLEELCIASRVYAGAKVSIKKDLTFLKNLKQLKVLKLSDLRLESFSFEWFNSFIELEHIQIQNIRYKENGKWRTFGKKEMETLLKSLPMVKYHNLDSF